MTLRQLDTFATVARLGSVTAAARELGISPPAVSAAVGALRHELADALYRRHGHGLVLTAQGRRLASLAVEITDLADRARYALDAPEPGERPLHVAVTSAVQEHVVGPLIGAFTERAVPWRVNVEVEPGARFAELLDQRRADVTLGPRPAHAEALHLVAVPFLRYGMLVVAPVDHRFSGRDDIHTGELEADRWLVGPGGVEQDTPTGAFLARSQIAPADVRAFPSDAAALAAVADREGVMLVPARVAAASLRRRSVTRLAVRGTPTEGLWWACTLPEDQCLSGALALRRFAITAEATQAMAGPQRGVPAAIVRRPVHATLWGSVAWSK